MRPPIALAATPIGDDGDASVRLCGEFEKADVVAIGDTRRLLNLAGRLGIAVRGWILSFHGHNEADRAPAFLGLAREGKRVVVMSDAGMLPVSDPRYRLVALAACSGVDVEVVPGPSAVLVVLAVSGLATDRFCFEDSLSRKAGELAAAIRGLKSEGHTMALFESPCRLDAALRAMCEGFDSDRPACVCRELTKAHQETVRGSLGEFAERFSGEAFGEIVVVVASVPRKKADVETPIAEVLAFVDAGLRLKDAVAHVARRVDLWKKDLYDAAVMARAV